MKEWQEHGWQRSLIHFYFTVSIAPLFILDLKQEKTPLSLSVNYVNRLTKLLRWTIRNLSGTFQGF